MSTQTPRRERRIAALVHVGAMLLAFFEASIFGIPFLNVLIPLVLVFCAGQKGSFLNNQMREVFRFQAVTSFVMLVLLVAVVVGAMSYPAIMVPAFAVLLLAQVVVYLIPVIAACKLLFGTRGYAYPLVGSPRRKAYVASKTAAPAADAPTPEDADDTTRL